MTQLYAKIKNTSEYKSQQSYHVDSKGKHIPFPVEFKENSDRAFGGVGGNYPPEDLHFFVKIGEKFVRI